MVIGFEPGISWSLDESVNAVTLWANNYNYTDRVRSDRYNLHFQWGYQIVDVWSECVIAAYYIAMRWCDAQLERHAVCCKYLYCWRFHPSMSPSIHVSISYVSILYVPSIRLCPHNDHLLSQMVVGPGVSWSVGKKVRVEQKLLRVIVVNNLLFHIIKFLLTRFFQKNSKLNSLST